MTANIADTSPKWYVFDTVTPRYELREGAIVLAEVKYMRPECVWGTKNRIGFGHHHAAMRWGCSAFDHERITHLLIEAEDGIIFACKKCYAIPIEIMEPVVENNVCSKCWAFHVTQNSLENL